MRRLRVAILVAWMATLHPIAATQPADAFRVSKSSAADVQQETLQFVNPETKQTTEVFPGSYASSSGAAVVSRIEALMGRLDETDRNALIASKATAGFDRAITSWRAQPGGRRVALAVRYYREALFRLELEMTDDYGRADPVDPARYEFFTIAVCSRMTDAWTCGEEQLAEVAGRYKMPLPQTRAERIAAGEKLVEMVLSSK
jgi:hypothetical protein